MLSRPADARDHRFAGQHGVHFGHAGKAEGDVRAGTDAWNDLQAALLKMEVGPDIAGRVPGTNCTLPVTVLNFVLHLGVVFDNDLHHRKHGL